MELVAIASVLRWAFITGCVWLCLSYADPWVTALIAKL